jgi:endo-1,4-beta-xylanase
MCWAAYISSQRGSWKIRVCAWLAPGCVLGGLLGGCLLGCGGEGSAVSRPIGVDTSQGGESVAPLTCDTAAPNLRLDPRQATLAAAYQDYFKVGVAVGTRAASGRDPGAAELAALQYNGATPENAFKWQSIQNVSGQFTFEQADAFLQFAESHSMEVHGHTLVWHQQVPDWVFQPPAGESMTRELLLGRLEAHMSALAEHLGGRVRYWDVVNEAFNDDGSLRDTPWSQIIGPDYLEQAFVMADRFFPESKLVYNDFGMERPGKRDAVAALVRSLKAKNIRIDAVGTQGHFRLDTPSIESIEASIQAFAEAGADVLVTEMDVDVLPPASENQGADLGVNAALSARLDPYAQCLPTLIGEQSAARWASLFEVFMRHSQQVKSVTLWGVSDAHSWLNDWPVNGRTNYALLFDRELRPKAAWQSVMDAAQAGSGL